MKRTRALKGWVFLLGILIFYSVNSWSQISGTDLAQGKPAYSSSSEGAYTPSLAVDGIDNGGSRWASLTTDDQWLYVDLQDRYVLDSVIIHWETARAEDYDIQSSTYGSVWKTSSEVRDIAGVYYDTIRFSDTARYVRMKGIKRGTPWGYSFYTFQVYGHEKVTDAYLYKVTINPTSGTVYTGSSLQFSASGYDQNNSPWGIKKSWSTTGGGTIDVNGKYKATTKGTFKVKVTSEEGVTAEANVTVDEKPVLNALTISPEIYNMELGSSKQFSVTKLDQYGNVINTSESWSATGGSVNSSGLYVANTAGIFTVKVVSSGKEAKATVAVHNAGQSLQSVSVSPATKTMDQYSTFQFSASGLDGSSNAMNIVPSWTVTGGGTIDGQGNFTAQSLGTFEVKADVNGIYNTASVTINEVLKVNEITISPETKTMKEGETLQLSASALDQNGNVIATSPSWTVIGQNSVSASGLFTAKYPGVHKVVVAENGKSDTAIIKVYPNNTTNLALNKPGTTGSTPSEGGIAAAFDGNTGTRWGTVWNTTTDPDWIYVDLEDTFDIGAVVLDWEAANAKEYYIETSYDATNWERVAHYTDGTFTNHRIDSLAVFATGRYVRMYGISRTSGYGYSLWEFQVFESDSSMTKTLSGLSITPESEILYVGDSTEFSTLCYDQYGSIYASPVTYSASGGGTIDANGKFKATTAGNYDVIVQSGSYSDTAKVKIKTVSTLASISVTPETATILTDSTIQIAASGFDQYGDAYAVNPVWTATGGTVDVNGNYASDVAGEFKVIATDGAFKDTVLVTVNERPHLASITLAPSSVLLKIGDNQQFAATTLDQFGDPISVSLTWSADGCTINGSGLFYADSAGTYTVKAVNGAIEGTATVSISENPALADVVISNDTDTLYERDSVQILAKTYDQFGAEFAATITYSAPDGGSVSADGWFKSDMLGDYKVIAESGSFSDTAYIRVNDAEWLSSVSLSSDNDTIWLNETKQYTASGFDQNSNPYATTFDWSTSGTANITSGGLFSATEPGTYTVFATSGSFTATATIVVKALPVLQTIIISPASETINELETAQYSATTLDQYGNTISATLTWSVTGGGNIDSDGLFTSTTFGNFKVVAQNGLVSDTVDITINEIAKLNAVKISPKSTSIILGQTKQFTATAHDQWSNTFAATISWSVVEADGTVNSSGLFSTDKGGDYHIVASSGAFSDTALLSVIELPKLVTIEVTPESGNIIATQSIQLSAKGYDQFGDEYATTFSWVAIDGGSVNSDGLFSSDNGGQYRVVASSGAVSDTVSVTVEALEVASLVISPTTSTIWINETQQYSVTAYDQLNNVISTTVSWSVNDGGSVNVDGLYTPSKAGSFKVKATANGVEALSDITVKALPVLSKVVIAPKNGLVLLNNNLTLTAKGYDQYNDEFAITPSWEAIDGGSVNASGVFSSATAGSFRVVVSAGSFTDTSNIEVDANISLTTIKVKPSDTTIFINETKAFRAEAFDQFGDTYTTTFTWSVSDGSISSDGLFTPSAAGTFSIKATSGAVEGTASITVKALPELTKVVVEPAIDTIYEGEDIQLTATGYDQYHNVIGISPVWSAPDGGSVNYGLFTSNVEGIFDVVVTDGAIADTATILVLATPYLEKIELAPVSANIKKGQSIQFTAKGYSQYGKEYTTAFDWSVNGGGTIDANGLFVSNANGTFEMTVSSGNVNAKASITITEDPVLTTLTISPKSKTIFADEAINFTYSALDQFGNTITISKTWLAPDGGQIFNSGLFTVTSKGNYRVVIKSGSLSDTAFVTVNEVPALTSIVVTPAKKAIKKGQTAQFSATGYDQYGDVISASVSWNTDGGGAIDNNGLFTSDENGTFTITATSGLVKGTAEITITEDPVLAEIVIEPANGNVVAINTNFQFSAKGYDQFGNDFAISPSWTTIDGGDVTIGGIFKSSATGDFKVVAYQGGIADTVSITVYEPAYLKTIAISPSNVSIKKEQTQQFAATGYDQFNNEFTTTFTWSVDGGEIDNNGLYTGSERGNFTVTATSGNVTGTAQVEVIEDPVLSGLVITPQSAEIFTNENVQFTAKTTNQWGDDFNATVIWSAPDGGSVSNNGTFSSAVAGQFRVVAASGVFADTSVVTVEEAPVLAKIEVSPNSNTIYENETLQFDYKSFDQYGTYMFVDVVWSTNGGSITEDGLFTPDTAGIYEITATNGAVSDKVVVTVKQVLVLTSIQVTPLASEINTGETLQFTATTKDQNGDVIVATVSWSSNGGSITASGLFTPDTAGVYEITATSGNLSAHAKVTVIEVLQLSGITIVPETKSIKVGEKVQFTAKGYDQHGQEFAITPTWTAPDGGTISASGEFTSDKAGTFKVVVSQGNISDTAVVIVAEVPHLAKIELNAQVLNIKIGDELTINAKGYDQFGNEFPVTIIWNVKTGATVTSNGVFQATLAGTYEVEASVNGITKTITIVVNEDVSVPTVDNSTFEVYPNPSVDYINVRNSRTITVVKVYDVKGQLMSIIHVNGNSAKVDLKQFKKGVYHIVAEGKNYSSGTMIIKK